MAGTRWVRFVRMHRQWGPGDSGEFTRGVADVLVRSGKAEYIGAAELADIETATAEPRGEQQVVKRKRGRPRKHPVT
jgi:hypothetical protein